MSVIMLNGCASSTRVVTFNSNTGWLKAPPNCVINGAYMFDHFDKDGKEVWVFHKGKINIVEGSRIGPPTSH